MAHSNKTYYRPEVKSKIGDYIRGKISAQSLMHPSRINTKPIDKRQYALNAPSSINCANLLKSDYQTYQRKLPRPPLKDYIEGKVKLSDMVSPSRINSIPKERKHQTLMKSFTQELEETAAKAARLKPPFTAQRINNELNESASKTSVRSSSQDWCLSNSELDNFKKPFPANVKSTELSLVPIKRTNCHHGTPRRRKVMCKIRKVTKSTNGLSNGEQEVTEERIVEVPESLLQDKKNIPKFLTDRYNIPCRTTRRKPLAISIEPFDEHNPPVTTEQECKEPESAQGQGEDSLAIEVREPVDIDASRINDDGPTEQGDCINNTTTYFFEFFESSDTKSVTAEEIDNEDLSRRLKENQSDCHRNESAYGMHREITSEFDKFSYYKDLKSQILLERELLDLHRGMLKCDRNVMNVEHDVNEVTASLNTIQNVQNQQIKPIVTSMKEEQDTLKTQIQCLQLENQKLRTNLRFLHKRTSNYEKLMLVFSQAHVSKVEQMEDKLQTITHAQMKSIEMQNFYNKNMFEITNQIKRTYSELDSRRCDSTIPKSSKNSNYDPVTDITGEEVANR